MADTLAKILELMNLKGLSPYRLERESGIAISSIKAWKNGKSKPSLDAIVKLSNYFGVSVDYLVGKSASTLPEGVYPVESVVEFDELGTICAGYDGSIDEIKKKKKIEIPASVLHGRPKSDYFTLCVKGNSMYPRLLPNDTIFCLRTDSVDSGDYAVVIYDSDEATVKKVNYVNGEDWLELIPINPEYPTKRIEGADLAQCRVLGKVVRLIRDV